MFVVVHVSGAVHITKLTLEIDQVGEQAVNVGDRILSINGEDVAHWPISEVFTLLSKISLGAKVQLSLQRHAAKQETNVANALVLISPEDYKELECGGSIYRPSAIVLGSASFSSPLELEDPDL